MSHCWWLANHTPVCADPLSSRNRPIARPATISATRAEQLPRQRPATRGVDQEAMTVIGVDAQRGPEGQKYEHDLTRLPQDRHVFIPETLRRSLGSAGKE